MMPFSIRRVAWSYCDQVEEGVVERPEVGVDLLDEVAGQEAQLLAGLDRGPGQDDAVDGLVLEEGQGHGHGQVGLARPGRADAEDEVVVPDGLDVVLLVEALGVDGLAREVQGLGRGVVLEGGGGPLLEEVEGDEKVLLLEVVAPLGELADLLEVAPGEFDLGRVAVDDDLVAAEAQTDPEAGLEFPAGFCRGRPEKTEPAVPGWVIFSMGG